MRDTWQVTDGKEFLYKKIHENTNTKNTNTNTGTGYVTVGQGFFVSTSGSVFPQVAPL